MSGLIKFSPNSLSQNDFSQHKKFDPEICDSLTKIASAVKNKTVLHISSTPSGGGVAELLKSQVPFEKYLGLDSHWLTIEAPQNFFQVTKKIHDLLQGKTGWLTNSEKDIYLDENRRLSKALQNFLEKFRPDIIVLHDPQPLPLIVSIPLKILTILRLHIDLSTPNRPALSFLKHYIKKYDRIILSDNDYEKTLPWLDSKKIKIVLPAINPLSEKNRPMDSATASRILEEFGVNPSKPSVSQVSRFDIWKDPMGVIQAYYLAKKNIPNLQLILAGFLFAQDDPEAKEIFKRIEKHASGDHDIHLFSNPQKLKDTTNDTFINAVYTASTVMIQKSIREGFGLTITEAMWKGKAVIAGKTNGALLQIKNNKNGVLVNSPKSAAKEIIRLVQNKKLREKMGFAARKTVEEKFLIPRFVLDNVRIYKGLLN